MKNRKQLITLMTLLPWLSLPLLRKKTLKRFLPGTLFMCVYLVAEGILATRRKWWWFPFSIKPNVLAELPLILGPFFVGSFWIFKYTYGKFSIYFLVNLIVDSFFTIFMLNWFKKIGYVTLIRFTRIQLSLLFLLKSVLMYGFQYCYEKVFSDRVKKDEELESL
ncbi:hypothetical protein F0342_14260 [Bacillus sp. CH30_1T]|uniref:hypothetical protein n=1 Tax=Bacillus sp. CH30_1T TaxID=2604836 RepID=UPI0011EC111F|nr:hypothetical protein [Bacillus sp. CH30_1T]KAA0563179.1 hypothetical protein F0342_14260 [Bacillus sp. CH30_1T]